jgi:uncharacterized Zn finger protein (UPF0148 family)
MSDIPGVLSDKRECPNCGEPVSVDAKGKCLCYTCGGFVDSVPAGTMKAKREKDAKQESLLVIREYL